MAKRLATILAKPPRIDTGGMRLLQHRVCQARISHGVFEPAAKLGIKTGEGLRQWTPEQADAVRGRLSRFLAEQAKRRKQS
jgi:hypothetical protein